MLLDGKVCVCVCVCVCVQGLCNQTALVYVLTLPLNELYDLGQVSYCSVSGILICKTGIMISSFVGLLGRI